MQRSVRREEYITRSGGARSHLVSHTSADEVGLLLPFSYASSGLHRYLR